MIECDVVKVAYRQQGKDGGHVVSFSIHPNDLSLDLMAAAIGSQWRLRLVELDDDGNAVEA